MKDVDSVETEIMSVVERAFAEAFHSAWLAYAKSLDPGPWPTPLETQTENP